MEKYYLYRHIREDKNEPFYIGIGTLRENKSTIAGKYERAYDKTGRNKIWKDIFKKTVYDIEILLESESQEFIIEREKEFISLYGRIFNHTGILANITDGGEGVSGLKGKDNHKSKEIFQYDFDGNFVRSWSNAEEACREGDYNPSMIHRNCKGFIKSVHNYRWFYTYQGENAGVYAIYYSKNYCNLKPIVYIIEATHKITGQVIVGKMTEIVKHVDIKKSMINNVINNIGKSNSQWSFRRVRRDSIKLESPAKRIESTLALEKIFV